MDLSSIKRAIAEGRVDADADGSIADPAAADIQWAERTLPRRGGTGNGHNGHAAPTVVAANRRRTEASCADLEDELHVLRSTCATPQDVQRWLREELGPIAARLRRIPARLAGLDDHIALALTELSDVEEAPPVAPAPRPRPATAAALSAYKTSLIAERSEITTAIRRGELVRTEEVVAEVADRMASCRSLLMNISAVALSDDDVPAEIERALTVLTEPADLHPVQFDNKSAPTKANGHDHPQGERLAAPEPLRKTKAAPKRPEPPRRRDGRLTLTEQMAHYNERVAVAQQLGLPFKLRGLNGSTFASHADGDAALAKINAAIEAATA